MPHATTADGTRIYYEEAGEGTPVIFAHEFCGDYRTWEPQMRALSRFHRCITFSARGYPPSDVPSDGARYSQDLAWQDVIAVLDHLQVGRAHVVGHSMGSYTALYVGLRRPERCLSLVTAALGYVPKPPGGPAERALVGQDAKLFAEQGMEAAVKKYSEMPARQQYKRKDPRGFAEFMARMREHSAIGHSLSLLHMQALRPTLLEMKPELEKLTLPLLVVAGDEDVNPVDAGIFLKRTVPRCALQVLPNSGHSIPCEEPDAFNAALLGFFATVDSGRWMTHRLA